MTEARVTERSDVDMGEGRDRRSNTSMDVAMEMTTPGTPTPVETAGATMIEPM
jgi:hypothetical protein